MSLHILLRSKQRYRPERRGNGAERNKNTVVKKNKTESSRGQEIEVDWGKTHIQSGFIFTETTANLEGHKQ